MDLDGPFQSSIVGVIQVCIPSTNVGDDNGVYQSADGGSTWQHFGQALPGVQVRDLQLNVALNTLTIGTYGRGVYEFFLPPPDVPSGAYGALRAVSGSSVWTGPVKLLGDPVTGSVTFGAACRGCPLRQRCTTSKKGRVLALHEHDAVLRAARRARATQPDLREDYRKQRGAAFTLRDFHDRFLQQGAPPIAIVRRALLK